MIAIYSARICPFAQRTRALLTHLDVEFELREIDLGNRDPAFLRLTPTGKVPLFLEGELLLYESDVINDYLAERYGWPGAYSGHPGLRARQRLAMKMWDQTIVTAFYASLRDPAGLDDRKRSKLEREIDQTAATIARMEQTAETAETMPAFHVAPFWARMDWLRKHTALPALFDARETLRAWLDRTVALPAVRATLPDRESTVKRYEEFFVGRR